MASKFSIVLTNDGLTLLQAAQAGETLTFTRIALGDGTLAGDARAKTALVSQKQTSNVASVVSSGSEVKIRADFSNSGLGTGYNMKEIGIFATRSGAPGVEKLYGYGNAGSNDDYMPAQGGSDVVTIAQEVIITTGEANVTLVVDQTGIYATQTQLTSHIGVGGTAQHPVVTSTVAGFMSPADKTKLDNHVGYGAATQHPIVTDSVSGFMSPPQKIKLDGIQTGAEVNQNAFSNVKVGATTIVADGKTDILELVSGANITITPDAANDKVTFDVPNAVTVAADQVITGAKTFSAPVAATNGVNPIYGTKFRITPEGGFAVLLTNKTGAASVKGTLVVAHSTVANAFALSPAGTSADGAIGVVYDAGIADGSDCWVVVAGFADMLLGTDITATTGQIAAMHLSQAGKIRTASGTSGGVCVVGSLVANAAAGALVRGVFANRGKFQ